MKAVTLKKKIIIPYDGYIPLKGINGPVTVPYMETFENISKLLMSGMPVKEVLRDGTKIDLTLMNYDKENSWNASSTEKKYESVTPVKGELVSGRKKNKVIIVTDEDVKAASMDSILSRGIKASAETSSDSAKSNVYEHGDAGTKMNNKPNKNKKNKHREEFYDAK